MSIASKYDTGDLTELLGRVKSVIKFLFESPNVEIYTYLCKSYQDNLTQLRSLRFLSLIDPEVSTTIVREADGYVTCLDCFNIKNFVKTKKLMFAYNFLNIKNALSQEYLYGLDFGDKNKHVQPYSKWLQEYQRRNEYYRTHYTLFDIFAGTFGINFQIKSEKFYQVFDLIAKENLDMRNDYKLFNELSDRHYYLKHKILGLDGQVTDDERLKMTEEFEKIKHIDRYFTSLQRDQLEMYDIGFDEIFLMVLFKDLHTIRNDLDNTQYIKFMMSNIFTIQKKYEIRYKSSFDSISPFDFLKDSVQLSSNDMIKMLEHIFGVSTGTKTGTKILGDYLTIKNKLKSERILFNNEPNVYSNLLMATFDTCIDDLYFKEFSYGIDFNNLSSHINYMFAKDYLYNIYTDIYEGKYGNFYDMNVTGGGCMKKYLKYKQKNIYLHNKINNIVMNI